MEFYRLRSEALPRKLYRVDYYNTWSKFVYGTGFQAATSDPNHSSSSNSTTFESASDIDAFWKAMRDQLNPRSAVHSPFVALFSNGRQAKNWALRWEVRNQRACHLVEISPMVLLRLDIPIFHPHTLRFRIPDLSNTQGSEYLCLHMIPEAAVVSRRSTSTIATVSAPRHLPHLPRRQRQLPGAQAPAPSDQISPPLFDFDHYASSDDDEQDEEEKAFENEHRQRSRRFSTHQVPGLDGVFYNSE
ncbi:hypothetical protein MMC22_003342 [Lobaria immixta]|nr:hypothetical protein [Lobaria immixta]